MSSGSKRSRELGHEQKLASLARAQFDFHVEVPMTNSLSHTGMSYRTSLPSIDSVSEYKRLVRLSLRQPHEWRGGGGGAAVTMKQKKRPVELSPPQHPVDKLFLMLHVG